MKSTRLVLALLVLGSGGCDSIGDATGPTPDPSLTVPPSGWFMGAGRDAPPVEILRALSLALQDPMVQSGVKTAMRRSPYLHHRLELGALLESPLGRPLATHMATGLRMNPSEFRSLVRSEPPVDILVLTREDRREWKGGGTVAVAWMPTLKSWLPARVFVGGVERSSTEVGPMQGPANVVFAVEPSREKLHRVNPQADVPGEVIQEPEDGEYVMRLRHHPANGLMSTLTLECEPGSDDCGDWGGVSGLMTLVRFCWLFADDPLGVGDVEIEFRARPMGGGHGVWDILFGGLPSATLSSPQCLVPQIDYVQWVPNDPGEYVVVEMWEKDTWPNGDDNKGQATWSYGQSGTQHLYYEGPGVGSGWATHGW